MFTWKSVEEWIQIYIDTYMVNEHASKINITPLIVIDLIDLDHCIFHGTFLAL